MKLISGLELYERYGKLYAAMEQLRLVGDALKGQEAREGAGPVGEALAAGYCGA